MSDVIGWTACALFFVAWGLDLMTESSDRERLKIESLNNERDEVDGWIARYDLRELPAADVEKLTAVQVIRLRGACARLLFCFVPHFAARRLVAK